MYFIILLSTIISRVDINSEAPKVFSPGPGLSPPRTRVGIINEIIRIGVTFKKNNK